MILELQIKPAPWEVHVSTDGTLDRALAVAFQGVDAFKQTRQERVSPAPKYLEQI